MRYLAENKDINIEEINIDEKTNISPEKNEKNKQEEILQVDEKNEMDIRKDN